jgi:hypothetical protein
MEHQIDIALSLSECLSYYAFEMNKCIYSNLIVLKIRRWLRAKSKIDQIISLLKTLLNQMKRNY